MTEGLADNVAINPAILSYILQAAIHKLDEDVHGGLLHLLLYAR